MQETPRIIIFHYFSKKMDDNDAEIVEGLVHKGPILGILPVMKSCSKEHVRRFFASTIRKKKSFE